MRSGGAAARGRDALREAHLVDDEAEGWTGSIQDILVCDLHVTSDVLTVSKGVSGVRKHADSCLGIVDTAAALTVMGDERWQDYQQRLSAQGLLGEIQDIDVDEVFRFGDGVTHACKHAKQFPTMIAGLPLRVVACKPPGRLTLLLGRDFHDKYLTQVDHGERTLRIGGQAEPLRRSHMGHPAVRLHPDRVTPLGRPRNGSLAARRARRTAVESDAPRELSLIHI